MTSLFEVTTHAEAEMETVKRWKRYGKDRLYVNGSDGTALGYVDLQTKTVVPTRERFRGTVSDAVARHLRET